MNSISSLHINDQPTWRGGEQQTCYLVKGLNERSHRAELVAQPDSALADRARKAGVTVHDIRMHGEGDLLAVRKIARLIAKEKFDVVHMHTSHAHALGCLACAFNRSLCVVSRRVINPIRKHALSPSIVKYRWRVDHYIAISEAVRSVLIAGGVTPDIVSVVYSGVEPPVEPEKERECPSQLAKAGQVIGAIGALAEHKGYEYLVQAMSPVLQTCPGVTLCLLGDGPMRADLEKLASRLEIPDAIMLIGFQHDVTPYLGSFDVFVAPSLMEGLNTSVIDAMMLAKPVIAADVGGMPEVVEHERTGVIVPPRDPDALAEAIIDLLTHPEKARQLGLAGREKAFSKLTASRMIEETIAVYESLLKRR